MLHNISKMLLYKRRKKHFSQSCSFMKNYHLCLKLIPLASSCFLRNHSLTDVFTFWYLRALCLSLFSGCLSATSCAPTSLNLHSSSFCASVAGFSLAISVSTSLSLSSLTSLDLSLCYPPSSPHTQPPASSISHEMGYTDFPVFKNTLFP